MKRLVGLLFASALLALIVIPVARVVNSLPFATDIRADGSGPAPPFPPPLVILLAYATQPFHLSLLGRRDCARTAPVRPRLAQWLVPTAVVLHLVCAVGRNLRS